MLIDTFGAGRPGDTPFQLWQLRTREELLESATRAALKSRSLLQERCRAAGMEHSRLKRELAASKRSSALPAATPSSV